MDGSVPEPRVGDRERREVDARLQQALGDGVLTLGEYDERAAQCWAARTRSELSVLTHDLPEPDLPSRSEPTPKVTSSSEVTSSAKAAGGSGKRPDLGERVVKGVLAVALAGAALYLGGQVVTADAVSIFGSRVVPVAPGQERLEVGSMFGSVTVVVPDGSQVRTAGTHVFGSVNCEEACRGGGPAVLVEANGAFGSVNIITQGEERRGVDLQRNRNGNRGNDRDED